MSDAVPTADEPPPDDEPAPDVAPAHVADGSASTDESPAPSVEDLLTALETVTAERDAHLDDLRRVTAEFANFRKQSEKRHLDVVSQAAARLAEELLPVLDAFDAAVAQGVEGLDHVREQLLTALQKQGLELLAEVGEPFDPHRHEAAMTRPAEDGDVGPVVAEVLRTGYGWNGKVLRAAMVAVRG